MKRTWYQLVCFCATAALISQTGGCGQNSVKIGRNNNSQTSPTKIEEMKLIYPAARKSDHVDDYHGTQVADPYRWLEDPDEAESRTWIDAQNELTFGYLAGIDSRDRIGERLTDLWNYERFGLPRRRGKYFFYSRNDGLQNQSVLYVTEGLDGEPRVLLDPNKLSEDGTTALTATQPSEDGRLLAYAVSKAGSDWREWHVRDVETGEDLDDHIEWSKFSGASWTIDGSGFFYSRYDAPKEGEAFTDTNYFQKLYFHKIGTPQADDRLVYQRTDEKEWGFSGSVTEDGRYLVISVWKGTLSKNQVFYQDLSEDDAPVVELLSGYEAEYGFVGNDGPVFWFTTDNGAANRRVIAIDTANPKPENWKELIPESEDALQGVSVVGDRFFASYLHNASTQIRVHELSGVHITDVELPAIGSAGGFGGRRDSTETFYSFSNFVTPSTIYRYDVANGKSTVYRRPDIDVDSDKYETRQVRYNSPDGTSVTMFLVHKKGLALEGTAPTILYGYGGFDISITPSFSVVNLTWLDMGGVYAVPNLRGGGEYGREWHEAGMKENKQNVFDDFIAAAEWLIEHKYTGSDRLAISGGSNGGLLVGATMTQRPDLIAAALPAVGVLDMLRYHEFTIGWAWASEYGSSDNPDEFPTLLAYSPLHNIKPGTHYPATMITTGDHDDRVVPAHSFKFAATLQAAQAGNTPTLIRIETDAGHGAGKPVSKRIEEATDRLAFLTRVLGMGDVLETAK